MQWFLLIVPLIITYYTFSYGYWAWKNGYRRGAIGVFLLALFTLALAIFGIFFRKAF